jgi:prepilin-type N-terminal cleavage/methylation domain-containing protein
MKNTRINQKTTLQRQRGVSMPELLIVFFVIAILVVLALPQLISSRRAFRFSGFQRQLVASLREARQEAMSQRTAITFRYDDANKKIVVYGGSFGTLGNTKNRFVSIAGEGLQPGEVIYGRPAGAPVSALADSATLTSLSANAVEVKFQADGSVVDASDVPINKALFFYNSKNPAETAFAVSVLGAGGRAKIWRYSQGVNAYVE